jgi:hypothetical protein
MWKQIDLYIQETKVCLIKSMKPTGHMYKAEKYNVLKCSTLSAKSLMDKRQNLSDGCVGLERDAWIGLHGSC